ncbi:phosphatidylserine decarboxylase subunit beta [Thiomicrospira aerophila AL3]|uniref:Phosphatidylserine decarboxylase proenzyme n=1 Tax=Thiomicrospira aerophila AL3 TaxID=717772 RepID=W0DVP3_9GAMM|nr:archaetidylserine decarboxylase [Thiomicrospira aerophila]AHF01348.1 phosphatidylserine decarboxylase subunit beta [Thiomicrospira aerophila AL3]
MLDYVKVVPQYLVPQHMLSNMMHWFMHIEQPWIKRQTIRALTKLYDIDLTDAVKTEPEDYPHFNAFFTRALKADARPIAEGQQVWVSPVDGVISQSARLDGNQMVQAKCHDYTIEALLGGDIDYAKQFHNGQFGVIYLSPRDYHRIHLPMSAQLISMTYVPGDLFAVNPATVKLVPGLFARNERLVLRFQTDQGPYALVMVGAIFVGSMETVFEGKITPHYGPTIKHWDYTNQNLHFNKGDEIGRFNMGSTVVLVTPEGLFSELGQQASRFIKMGEAFTADTRADNQPNNSRQDTDNDEDEHAIGGI